MTITDQCLSDADLQAISDDSVSADARCEFEQHLSRCPNCCDRLEGCSVDLTLSQAAQQFLPDDADDCEAFTCRRSVAPAIQDEVDLLLQKLAPTDDPQMLGRVGSFEVSGVIGSGGMGIVLKAFEPALARYVALKVLSPRYWHDGRARERFSRESRAAASIVHESVIEIFGVTEAHGIPFLAMPYIRGDSLQRRLDRTGPLSVEEILRIAMQVAAGLAAAHEQGLVHRDIKPANILLGDGTDRVRITDFGIAIANGDPQITTTGFVAGTPQYMSPEQVRGESIDGRSDLFSLGSVMYAMCVGRPPFEAETQYELLNRIVDAKPERLEILRPDVPTWLAAIIRKLLAPCRDERFHSATEAAALLKQCLAARQQLSDARLPDAVLELDQIYSKPSRTTFGNRLLKGPVMITLMAVVLALVFPFVLPTQPIPLTGGNEEAGAAAAGTAATEPITLRGRLVDESGVAVVGQPVLAVQKTWPSNRYSQNVLKTVSDQDGNFAFDNFAVSGSKYAFLLSAVSDRHVLTSEYRVVDDGSSQEPVVLRLAAAEPVTLQFVNRGKPIKAVAVIPSLRTTSDGDEYMCYAQQLDVFGLKTDEAGTVKTSWWKSGESGSLYYQIGEQVEEAKFKVDDSRTVTIEVPDSVAHPAAASAVHVEGRVIDSAGHPLADCIVLAIRKTWPKNRFRQDGLSQKTDKDGRFRFEKFAAGNGQYAFLLTVATEGYALSSVYQVVKEGSQQEPIELVVEKNDQVVFTVVDESGQPLHGIALSPAVRNISGGEPHLNYHLHSAAAAKTTDSDGRVGLSFWKRGESGSLYFTRDKKDGRVEVNVPQSGEAKIILDEST